MILRSALGAALIAGAAMLGASTASAAPFAAPSGLDRPADGITEAQMSRRQMNRRRMMRSRRAAPSSVGNARNPSRAPMQQNQGTTSGGPRY